MKALEVFDWGGVGRRRGPAAQERELEQLVEPRAQHFDASSAGTGAPRPLQTLMGSSGLRPARRAAGCTGQSRPGGDHDQGAKVGRAT